MRAEDQKYYQRHAHARRQHRRHRLGDKQPYERDTSVGLISSKSWDADSQQHTAHQNQHKSSQVDLAATSMPFLRPLGKPSQIDPYEVPEEKGGVPSRRIPSKFKRSPSHEVPKKMQNPERNAQIHFSGVLDASTTSTKAAHAGHAPMAVVHHHIPDRLNLFVSAPCTRSAISCVLRACSAAWSWSTLHSRKSRCRINYVGEGLC